MMTATDIREALENVSEFDFQEQSVWGLDVVTEAARAYADLLTEGQEVNCPTCYGLGEIPELYTDDIVADAVRQRRCPTCKGGKRLFAVPAAAMGAL